MARARRAPWWRLTPLKAVFVVLAGIAAGLTLARLQRPQILFPKDLLPSFADRLVQLFERMQARGYDPVLVLGPRSEGRQMTLTHYGAAVYVASASAGTADPGFFKALGDETELLDLTWGGKWGDRTLVQAIPRFLESEFRGLETAGGREQFLRETYAA